jgi:hypothetical protein
MKPQDMFTGIAKDIRLQDVSWRKVELTDERRLAASRMDELSATTLLCVHAMSVG